MEKSCSQNIAAVRMPIGGSPLSERNAPKGPSGPIATSRADRRCNGGFPVMSNVTPYTRKNAGDARLRKNVFASNLALAETLVNEKSLPGRSPVCVDLCPRFLAPCAPPDFIMTERLVIFKDRDPDGRERRVVQLMSTFFGLFRASDEQICAKLTRKRH